jgi:tetratricopeptide (TPR) repeat protein
MKKHILSLGLGILVCSGISAQSSQYSTLYNEGVEKIGKKQYREAIALFDNAILLKPDYKEAIMARGQSFLMIEERDKACADFALSTKLGWAPAKEYVEKYCGANAPGRKLKTKKATNASGQSK